uniref:Heat shock protein 70 n=1 Tax=Panagrolaimus davidi TaxID=227884 RepID=A0A914QJB7_9BILA
MAKARLNGEFGCFCSMNLVSDEKNDIKRAKECGFKKAEIIDSEKADLFETLGEKMQNETLYVTEHETRAPKENKMKQHSHNETEYCFMETEQSTLNKSDNTNAKIENSGEVLKELMPSAFSDTRYFTMSTKKISNKIKINAVGIDLGTSRCCAAVNRNNGIEAFPLDNTGERQLPSYVAYDEENVICGIVALKRLRNYSKSTIFDSKRIIGRSLNEIEIDLFWPFGLSEKDGKVQMEVQKFNGINKDLVFGAVTPEEVATSLLKHIKQKAEEIQSTTLKQCVITIPAAFNESQKNATMKAAKDAGWEEIELLPEPVAAAFTYFVKRPIPSNSNILVFDLGGGTLDVCIFKIKNNQMECMHFQSGH